MTRIARPLIAGYIAAFFVRYTVMLFMGLLSLILAIDVVGESTRILAAPGADASALWSYAALRAPVLASQIVPFIVLLGALGTTMTLAFTSQVAAMQSSGVSIHQIVAPMAAVGLLCAGLHFALNELVAVHSLARLSAWQAAGYGLASAPEPSKEIWIDAGSAIVRAGKAVPDADALRLEDVTIFRQAPGAGVTEVTTARSALVTPAGGTLNEVTELNLASNSSRFSPEEPWTLAIPLSRFFETRQDPRHLDVVQLVNALTMARATGRVSSDLAVDLHHKFTWPLACVLMPLFGALSALSFARAGSVLPRAACGFLLGFIYFVVDSFVGAMGRSGDLPALLAAWLPLLLFFLIAQFIVLRLGSPALARARENAAIH